MALAPSTAVHPVRPSFDYEDTSLPTPNWDGADADADDVEGTDPDSVHGRSTDAGEGLQELPESTFLPTGDKFRHRLSHVDHHPSGVPPAPTPDSSEVDNYVDGSGFGERADDLREPIGYSDGDVKEFPGTDGTFRPSEENLVLMVQDAAEEIIAGAEEAGGDFVNPMLSGDSDPHYGGGNGTVAEFEAEDQLSHASFEAQATALPPDSGFQLHDNLDVGDEVEGAKSADVDENAAGGNLNEEEDIADPALSGAPPNNNDEDIMNENSAPNYAQSQSPHSFPDDRCLPISLDSLPSVLLEFRDVSYWLFSRQLATDAADNFDVVFGQTEDEPLDLYENPLTLFISELKLAFSIDVDVTLEFPQLGLSFPESSEHGKVFTLHRIHELFEAYMAFEYPNAPIPHAPLKIHLIINKNSFEKQMSILTNILTYGEPVAPSEHDYMEEDDMLSSVNPEQQAEFDDYNGVGVALVSGEQSMVERDTTDEFEGHGRVVSDHEGEVRIDDIDGGEEIMVAKAEDDNGVNDGPLSTGFQFEDDEGVQIPELSDRVRQDEEYEDSMQAEGGFAEEVDVGYEGGGEGDGTIGNVTVLSEEANGSDDGGDRLLEGCEGEEFDDQSDPSESRGEKRKSETASDDERFDDGKRPKIEV